MDEHGMASSGASWQRMAVWLARAGYGELEYSTVMTVRAIARPRSDEVAARPAMEVPAALPLVLVAAAD